MPVIIVLYIHCKYNAFFNIFRENYNKKVVNNSILEFSNRFDRFI